MKKIYLVDGDNNINLGLRGIEMLAEDNHVMIFHSKAMEITKFKKKLAGCRAHIEFIESVRSGKNSLDFQITTELGFLSNNKDLECAYIISCDKGYDAAVDYVKSRYSAKFKELDRKESIFDSFQMAFALKAKTKSELSSALVKEYGPEHGLLVYNHLKSLFGDATEEAPVEVTTDVKLMEKAEKTVAEVQSRVKKSVKNARAKAKLETTKPESVVVTEPATAPAAVVVDVVEPVEVVSTRDRRKTRPERKPKAAKARHGSEKSVSVEEKLGTVQETILREGSAKLDAAAEVVVEKVEAVAQKAEAVKQKAEAVVQKAEAAKQAVEEKVEEKVETLKGYDLPLRFGSVRTEEQNKSFYKSKDLRKKTKPQEEAKGGEAPAAVKAEEAKVEEAHVEAVVEMVNENKEERRDGRRDGNQRRGDRRSSNRGRDGQRRPRRTEGEGVKPVEAKAPVQQKPAEEKTEAKKPVETVKPAETTKPAAVNAPKAAAPKKEAPAQKSAAPAKKASGQNHGGFFGRMFGKKKK